MTNWFKVNCVEPRWDKPFGHITGGMRTLVSADPQFAYDRPLAGPGPHKTSVQSRPACEQPPHRMPGCIPVKMCDPKIMQSTDNRSWLNIATSRTHRAASLCRRYYSTANNPHDTARLDRLISPSSLCWHHVRGNRYAGAQEGGRL